MNEGDSIVVAADSSWQVFADALLLQAGFNATVVTTGTALLGGSAGIVGVFALLRRRSLVADAMSHATLPGVAIAFLVATALDLRGMSLPVLLLGATLSGGLGVLAIDAIVRFSRLREDAAIGIVLSVFFGFGVVALSWIQANSMSSSAGIDHFLEGRAASMLPRDTGIMAVLALVVAVLVAALRRELTLVCFDESFARMTGWPTALIDLTMLMLMVLVTVAGLQAVGIVLIVSLLIIPPVTARFWSDRLAVIILVAAGVGLFSGYLGTAVSTAFPDLPTGAVIVLVAASLFLASLLLAPNRGVLGFMVRRWRLRMRIESDHLLEAVAERLEVGAVTGHIDPEVWRTLHRLRGWSEWFARIVLFRLRRHGMVEGRGSDAVVTLAGCRRGREVIRNHRLWERYLVAYADIAPNHVDWSVDQVEHVLSPELIAELERDLERVSDHGSDLP